jgi:hypothetical protein
VTRGATQIASQASERFHVVVDEPGVLVRHIVKDCDFADTRPQGARCAPQPRYAWPMRTLLTLSFLGALAAGCYGEGGYGAGYSYGYATASPGLVYVSPGVQVIADYDYPVFYSDNYYWRYDNGLWYRSGGYNGGWSVSYDVPYGVRSIDRPYNYVHYRGNWNGNNNYGYRNTPVVNDHRSGGYQPAYRPAYQAPRQQPVYQGRQPVYQGRQAPVRTAPVVRDHRR